MFWKRLLRKSDSYRRILPNKFFVLCAVVLLAHGLRATDKVKELQDHFDKDAHAGSKVKSLARLGDAQFEAAGKAIQANDYVAAGLTYEKYRDNVRAALDLLKKQEPDVDRHPGNYRQLELEIRKGIREVEEARIVAPPDLRPPLVIVHKDLLDMDDELIHLLFPRRSKDPEKAPPSTPSIPEVKP